MTQLATTKPGAGPSAEEPRLPLVSGIPGLQLVRVDLVISFWSQRIWPGFVGQLGSCVLISMCFKVAQHCVSHQKLRDKSLKAIRCQILDIFSALKKS